uniref:Nucleotide PPase n=1 Tax=Globodera pallida TaxID=36090 RepID=A0A183BSN9_GLOPA
MRQIGIDPVVVPSNCPEDLPRTMQVAQFVEQTARQKAVEVAKRLAREKVPFDALVGCDTMISVDGELIGKPKDAEDAFKILRMLSARSHVVRTGVCIVDSCGAEAELFSVESRVEFGQLSDELIKQYIMTGEPMNRAGAYAIQGKGAVLVKAIFGSFSNIVGLPLFELVQKLDKLFTKKE